MKTIVRTPFYLLDPKSPLIAENQPVIAVTATSGAGKLAISVPPVAIDLKDATGAQEIILALQHFPQHIEKMLGTLHFDFEMKAGTELFIPEADWKMNPRYLRWFRAMSSLEIMPFFVKDKDARLYMLAGDYLIKNRVPVLIQELEDDRTRYFIGGGMRTELSKRLSDSCKQFLFYCHNTGFNPKEAILSMLADYSLPVHYIDIYKQYQKEIADYERIYSIPDLAYRFKAV